MLNNSPKLFTDAATAIAMAERLQGVVYRFGDIYKLYYGDMPLPANLSPYWVGRLSNDTLASYLATL